MRPSRSNRDSIVKIFLASTIWWVLVLFAWKFLGLDTLCSSGTSSRGQVFNPVEWLSFNMLILYTHINICNWAHFLKIVDNSSITSLWWQPTFLATPSHWTKEPPLVKSQHTAKQKTVNKSIHFTLLKGATQHLKMDLAPNPLKRRGVSTGFVFGGLWIRKAPCIKVHAHHDLSYLLACILSLSPFHYPHFMDNQFGGKNPVSSEKESPDHKR